MYYFLLNPYVQPTKANYQHACVVIAEGFKKLGIPFGGNIDYYPDPKGDYLIKATEFKDQELIITSAPEDFKDRINELVRMPYRRLIVVDTKDEWVRPKSLQFLNMVYRYYLSSALIESKIIRPWVFGYTQRMLDAIEPTPWSEREDKIAVAHRVDNHQVRNMVFEHYKQKRIPHTVYHDGFQHDPVSEEERHWWAITGRRHSEAYFSFIGRHKAIDAHGGYLKDRNTLVQWDSWKVWEGFLSGTLVITADLDFYKIKLPFPLKPWIHYIPVRYDQLQVSYEKLFRLPDNEWQKIAEAGREYVVEHYAPERLAEIIQKNM